MAKRIRPIIGVQRRFSWRLYLTPEQYVALRKHGRMCAELWNALMELWETAREARVWYMHDAGIVLFDLAGNHHLLSLGDILLRRSVLGQRRQHITEILRPHATEVSKLHPQKSLQASQTELRTGPPSEFDMGYWITSLLAEKEEWRALSTWTPRRVATSLRAAWTAFFQRAKNGGGASSGYPRYKSIWKHFAIPHRGISGCKMRRTTPDDGRKHGPNSWMLRLKGVSGEIWAKREVPWSEPDDPQGGVIHEWLDADVRLIDGKWEFSAALDIERKRRAAIQLIDIVIRFDLLDCFCTVNGKSQTPDGFADLQILADKHDTMQAEFDLRWPRGKRLSHEERAQRREEWKKISGLSAYIARCRRDILHVWTARIVRMARSLIVIKPAIKENTKTPRGNEKQWGAAVEVVSSLNRNTLSYAPALAAAMLEYKARELMVWCDPEKVEDTAPKIGIGKDITIADKQLRRDRRAIRKEKVNGEGIKASAQRKSARKAIDSGEGEARGVSD